jgi:hypothetical protein
MDWGSTGARVEVDVVVPDVVRFATVSVCVAMVEPVGCVSLGEAAGSTKGVYEVGRRPKRGRLIESGAGGSGVVGAIAGEFLILVFRLSASSSDSEGSGSPSSCSASSSEGMGALGVKGSTGVTSYWWMSGRWGPRYGCPARLSCGSSYHLPLYRVTALAPGPIS